MEANSKRTHVHRVKGSGGAESLALEPPEDLYGDRYDDSKKQTKLDFSDSTLASSVESGRYQDVLNDQGQWSRQSKGTYRRTTAAAKDFDPQKNYEISRGEQWEYDPYDPEGPLHILSKSDTLFSLNYHRDERKVVEGRYGGESPGEQVVENSLSVRAHSKDKTDNSPPEATAYGWNKTDFYIQTQRTDGSGVINSGYERFGYNGSERSYDRADDTPLVYSAPSQIEQIRAQRAAAAEAAQAAKTFSVSVSSAYAGGGWNPGNWYRWAATGDANATDDVYRAALEAGGQSVLDGNIAGKQFVVDNAQRGVGLVRVAQAGVELFAAGTLAPTGVGTVGSFLLVAHAVDTLQTGLQEISTGESAQTYGSQALEYYVGGEDGKRLGVAYDVIPGVYASLASAAAGASVVDDVGEGLLDDLGDDFLDDAAGGAGEAAEFPESVVKQSTPGVISDNPANKLIETGTPLKNDFGWRKRWYRMNEADYNAYQDAIFHKNLELEEATKGWYKLGRDPQNYRMEEMGQFRNKWLSDFRARREY